MHSIDTILVEIEHIKDDFKKYTDQFKAHDSQEKIQFKNLEKQNYDIIGVIGRLTTAIEVYGGKTSVNIKWLKIIGTVLFTGVGIALSYFFFEIENIKDQIRKDEVLAKHEIEKDVYYDNNRAVIFQMIEKYKLDKDKK